jgi:hypothetical protein
MGGSFGFAGVDAPLLVKLRGAINNDREKLDPTSWHNFLNYRLWIDLAQSLFSLLELKSVPEIKQPLWNLALAVQ